MKGLMIAFSAPNLTIPFNYNHEVQSLLYSLLGELKDKYHNDGFGERKYKLFTFSSLRGKKRIKDRRLCFADKIYLDVRSVHDDFCDALFAAMEKRPTLTFFNQELTCVDVNYLSPKITMDNIAITMLSPLEIHTTDNEKHTTYYSVNDDEFTRLFNDNFAGKYEAYMGEAPQEPIKISAISIRPKDKVVTRYKGNYITAWRGIYELKAKPEYLNFLYYCGLGSRNSAGFGMFEVM